MIASITERCVLSNGLTMPWLGLGVWKIRNETELYRSVQQAVLAGYRGFDTATVYGNEQWVGSALRRCGLHREEMFVTTKLWNKDATYHRTLQACDESLIRLGMDYIDLYLIHWPIKGQYQEVWDAFVELQKQGKVRSIGVSNFQVHHLKELLSHSNVIPVVNQVEFHPLCTQVPLRTFCAEHHIQVQAWSPLMQGNFHDIPQLDEIAAGYGKSVPQVILRWNLQHGIATTPKSTNGARIVENASIFDFQLSHEHMDAIDTLNRDQRFGEHPDKFAFRD